MDGDEDQGFHEDEDNLLLQQPAEGHQFLITKERPESAQSQCEDFCKILFCVECFYSSDPCCKHDYYDGIAFLECINCFCDFFSLAVCVVLSSNVKC